MPQLVGLNYYAALLALQAAGIYEPLPVYAFLPSSITVQWIKSTYPPGTVVAQSIPYGDPATPGEDITLTVSLFPFGSNIDMPPDWRQRT